MVDDGISASKNRNGSVFDNSPLSADHELGDARGAVPSTLTVNFPQPYKSESIQNDAVKSCAPVGRLINLKV